MQNAKLILLLLLRLTAGGLFVYAGAVKLANPLRFFGDIQSYQILPYQPAVIVAMYLPWVEIAGGVAVIVKRLYPGALMLLTALLLVFLAVLTSAWLRGLTITCGCFGASETPPTYAWLFARDLLMVAMMAALGLAHFKQKT